MLDNIGIVAKSESEVTKTTSSASTISGKTVNLMSGVSPQTVNVKVASDHFISSTADFSVNLFKKSVTENKNSLISPLSVMLALSMTANGADNETLSQMEDVLVGDLSIEELNEYLCSYIESLPNDDSARFSIANSIWFRNGLNVESSFLQTNADYYGADAYQSAFDDQTLADINNWVNTKTDGLIDSILDEIDDQTEMYLINALVFDAEWEKIYTTDEIFNGVFTAADGSEQAVTYMGSDENLYINDGKATGFIKPYAGGNYSFVALLPNEGISIDNYIQSLSGDGFIKAIKSVGSTSVRAILPKFSYDYSVEMKDALIDIGINDAFTDEADFNKMISGGGLYISRVIHKTFISVDEHGTKAGAATAVEMEKACIDDEWVRLDRPFIYAIIDNSTDLPIFIGTVMSFAE